MEKKNERELQYLSNSTDLMEICSVVLTLGAIKNDITFLLRIKFRFAEFI